MQKTERSETYVEYMVQCGREITHMHHRRCTERGVRYTTQIAPGPSGGVAAAVPAAPMHEPRMPPSGPPPRARAPPPSRLPAPLRLALTCCRAAARSRRPARGRWGADARSFASALGPAPEPWAGTALGARVRHTAPQRADPAGARVHGWGVWGIPRSSEMSAGPWLMASCPWPPRWPRRWWGRPRSRPPCLRAGKSTGRSTIHRWPRTRAESRVEARSARGAGQVSPGVLPTVLVL